MAEETLPADLPHRKLIVDLVRTLEALRVNYPCNTSRADDADPAILARLDTQNLLWFGYDEFKKDLLDPKRALGTYDLLININSANGGPCMLKNTRGHARIVNTQDELSTSLVGTVYEDYGGQIAQLEKLEAVFKQREAELPAFFDALNRLYTLVRSDEYAALVKERAQHVVPTFNTAVEIARASTQGGDWVVTPHEVLESNPGLFDSR